MDIVLPELANAVYQDRVREAQKTRRISGVPETERLHSVLRGLMQLFSRS